MAIRLRCIDGILVALCAARSVALPGDIYLDDNAHQALYQKFAIDLNIEGWGSGEIPVDVDYAHRIAKGESDNASRLWWDNEYGADHDLNIYIEQFTAK